VRYPALPDGAELAEAVAGHPTVDAALDAYERVMLPRGAENATTAGQMLSALLPDTDADDALFPDAPSGRPSPRPVRARHTPPERAPRAAGRRGSARRVPTALHRAGGGGSPYSRHRGRSDT